MAESHQLTKKLIQDDLGLKFNGVYFILPNVLGNIYFVNATEGVDATGLKGRIDRPYKTIQAAVSAAPGTGDVIEVYPGNYAENVTGGISKYYNVVLRGATLTGNVNINANSGGGILYLLQGSKLIGNVNGTFGSGVISDGTGELQGQVGTVGDNGGHTVKGLRLWSSTTQICPLRTNCAIEDIGIITCSGEFTFQFGNSQEGVLTANRRNPVLRNIRLIRNTSALATARVFLPTNEACIDVLENIGLIQCDNGKIYNDAFRGFAIYYCSNVTFKSKLQCIQSVQFIINAYNTRFICTDERIGQLSANAVSKHSLKFYNCQFQSGGAEIFNFISDVELLEMYTSQYNKTPFYIGTAPTVENTGFHSFLGSLSLRTYDID